MSLLTPSNNGVGKDKNLASRFKGTAHKMALPFSILTSSQRQNFKQFNIIRYLGFRNKNVPSVLKCSQNLKHNQILALGVSPDQQSNLLQY